VDAGSIDNIYTDTIHITSEGCESFFTLDRDFTVKSEVANSTLATINSARQKNRPKSAQSGSTSSNKNKNDRQQD